MGRELRKVPKGWKHPKNKEGRYIPLFDGNDFKKELSDWMAEKKQWDNGLRDDFEGGWKPKEGSEIEMSFEEWHGEKPRRRDYMPQWNEKELTHIQLYETTSEGTPKTPIFKADELEKLCEYAAKNCYTFADFRASKEEWMQMLSKGFVYAKEGNKIFC